MYAGSGLGLKSALRSSTLTAVTPPPSYETAEVRPLASTFRQADRRSRCKTQALFSSAERAAAVSGRRAYGLRR